MSTLNTRRKSTKKTPLIKKWNEQEEGQLMDEIYNFTLIDEISRIHNRTIEDIQHRIKIITHKLYMNFVPLYEIISKTGLNELQVLEAVRFIEHQKQEEQNDQNDQNDFTETQDFKISYSDKQKITKLKSEIKSLHTSVKKSHDMMNFILGYITKDQCIDQSIDQSVDQYVEQSDEF